MKPSALANPLLTPQIVGRYALYGEIASGGMATVKFGRLLGEAGFQRTVAIKRLHPQYASDENFVQQFVNEARLASHISHPNVVRTFDVVRDTNELLLVMEYVHGETLSRLLKSARQSEDWIPEAVGLSIICDALRGLHAAHEATDESGMALRIVHRDISPENIVVDTEGRAAVLDFGIAKAQGALFSTDGSQLKGKFRYMSPEQVRGKKIDQRSDVFAMGVTLFRVLTKRHVFGSQQDAATALYRVLNMPVRKPSMIVPTITPALDAVVMKSLERDPNQRFATAEEFALAIEAAVPVARHREVGLWVESVAGAALKARAEQLRQISAHSQSGTFRIGHSRAFTSDSQPAPIATPLTEEAVLDSSLLESAPCKPVESLALAHVWPARPTDVVVEYPSPNRRYLGWAFCAGVTLAAIAGGILWQFNSIDVSTPPRATSGVPRQVSVAAAPRPQVHDAGKKAFDPVTPAKPHPAVAREGAGPLPAISTNPPLKRAPLPRPKAKSVVPAQASDGDADPLSRRH